MRLQQRLGLHIKPEDRLLLHYMTQCAVLTESDSLRVCVGKRANQGASNGMQEQL